MSRGGRRAAKVVGMLCGLGLAALLLGDGVDTWDVRTHEVLVPVPRLPRGSEGLRIAVLSDLHVHPEQPEGFLAEAFARAQDWSPDIIVLPGDFVSLNRRYLEDEKELLAGLSAPLGVYACLGNHDWIGGRGPQVTKVLEEAGVRVLVDEAVALPGHPDCRLIGLDVHGPAGGDLDRALEGVGQDECKIMLAHTPDIVLAASQLAIDLVVSGHTHGGQVCLPLVGPLIVPSAFGPRFAAGLFNVDGTRLFVTRGVGSHAKTMRFRCAPEVALLTLTRSDRALPSGRWGVDLRTTVTEYRRFTNDLRHWVRRR